MGLILVAALCIPAVLVLGLVVFGIGLYNGLVKLKVLVDEAWSGIDVQLKRRYDLIPNIVETVKGYAKHEQDTLTKVVELRNMAMNSNAGIEEQGKLENQLTGALKTIFALAENYPDLKADQGFRDLQKSLTDIESEIQGARRYYNGTVREYNTKIAVFPNNIFAGMLGFKAREFFEADEDERENVKVDFTSEEAKA
ncbi:LemA family protein [Candidatus Dojkabacteria bacterium]|uniref:LemA family protein n=1 Tax=Candidatus Dojkabacteria bacterium TaxID=2099670 RepID=A0A955RJ07_9BACT|nr:LemA family protein [Candidatus Dojkabacteria bacterium]